MLSIKDINHSIDTVMGSGLRQQSLNIFDHHFVSTFDIKDQNWLNRKFKNRVTSANYLIKELINSRKRLAKFYNRSLCKNKSVLLKINYLDGELDKARSNQAILMRDFYDYLKRDYLDQTLPSDSPKPIQNIYHFDVYLSDGVDIIGAQITSKTSVIWEYVRFGTGVRKAEIADQDLEKTLGAFPIDEGGSFSSIGDQIRLFCVLPETIENANISEYSINEFAEGGKTLSRTVLEKPIKHIVKEDLPTITNVTYIIPHQDL